MDRVYDTAALIQILADERRACMRGDRLDLQAQPSGTNHVIDRLIEPTGIQKFTAYDNFRNTIHQYQSEHQVSGIVWQSVTIANQTIEFPQIDDQLISLGEDLPLLWAAQPAVLAFWRSATAGMDCFLADARGVSFTLAESVVIEPLMARSQWATLSHHGRDRQLEVILQLGWGHPEIARERQSDPASGRSFIHAVFPGREPLG
jgi:hypothetical protein